MVVRRHVLKEPEEDSCHAKTSEIMDKTCAHHHNAPYSHDNAHEGRWPLKFVEERVAWYLCGDLVTEVQRIVFAGPSTHPREYME